MSYLLDTNVLSELAQPLPSVQVIKWLEARTADLVFMSVVSVGELHRGIVKLPQSRRRDALIDWFENNLLVTYSGFILPIVQETMILWGDLAARLQKRGRTLPILDGLLAATALEHDLILVTRNVKNFEDSGVQLVNPWEREV